MRIEEILARAPVLPVLVIQRLEDAVPLARALVDGGLPVLEVTLRTPVAWDAVRAIRETVSGALVGVGTVRGPADLDTAAKAGARFAVSPGLTPALARAAVDSPVPLLPGVMTVSETMTALDAGFTYLKFFPAQQAGGAGFLRALAGPIPDARFCPTGGVTLGNAPSYLALPNVVCVGGSWMVPAESVNTGDWATIARLAAGAAALR